jgi:hypothetical protein
LPVARVAAESIIAKTELLFAVTGLLRSGGFTGGYDLGIFPDIALANAA